MVRPASGTFVMVAGLVVRTLINLKKGFFKLRHHPSACPVASFTMKHVLCSYGARRAWSGALRCASKKKRTPSRETAWGPEVCASNKLAPSSRGIGGWGATRSA